MAQAFPIGHTHTWQVLTPGSLSNTSISYFFSNYCCTPAGMMGKSMPPRLGSPWLFAGWSPGSTAGTCVPLPTQAGGLILPIRSLSQIPPMMSQAPHLPAEASHPAKMSACAQTGNTWCWWAPRVPGGVGVQGQLISPMSKSNC